LVRSQPGAQRRKQVLNMLNFNKDVANIGGWLTKPESYLLYSLAKKVKPGNVIVEIGSWKGRSTICLGKGSEDGNGAKIYAIDPHTGNTEHRKTFGKVDTYQVFQQNIKDAEVSDVINPIRKTSEEASKNFTHPVELIFIDGAHEYNSVKLDFELWSPLVINRGIIIFHDTWHIWGPNIFTAYLCLTSSRIKNPKVVDTITYFEKVEKNNFLDRLYNIGFMFYRTIWGIKGGLKMLYYDLQEKKKHSPIK
jgi:MMP 1-O-methyltransferase